MSRTKYVRIKAIPFGLAFSFPKFCHYSSTHSEMGEQLVIYDCTDSKGKIEDNVPDFLNSLLLAILSFLFLSEYFLICSLLY